jgi:curli biogenesis system outer membrane secretion channel CsgG
MKAIALRAAIVAALPLICLSAGAAEGPLAQKKGQGGSEIQGSAGPGGSQGDNGLEHCDKPMGAMAVVEPQDYVAQSLSRYNLQSPTGLIRMMVQQSNCFIVVERGLGMQNMMQERALQESGELRQNSNMGGGQMVSADFVLTPAVVFSENNAGGVGGALGGLLGGRTGNAIGAVAGGLKFKEAQTSMLVTDSRSGVQVAAAEGSSKKADLRLGVGVFGGGAAGGLGGYANTNEGKVIAASLMDNYNNVVKSVRSQPSLQRDVG